MFVMITTSENVVETVRLFDDYDSAAYVAVNLIKSILGDGGWFKFVQSDSMPNFSAGESYDRHGLRISIVGPLTSEVYI
jgi:hypothetical protein